MPSRRQLIEASLAVALSGAWSAARADDLPWTLPRLKTVPVNGQDIAYFEQGSGPALVLVHGMSGSAALEWGRVMGPLSQRFHVVAPYQIGFGPSAQPDLPYDAKTFVDYLGGLLDALKLERPTIVGESFGGWVVAQYALAQGGRTRWGAPLPRLSKLVIVDGAVHVRARPSSSDNGASKSINDPAVAAEAGKVFASQPRADNSRVTQQVMGGSIVREAVQPDALARLKVPTLVMWGEQDQLIPLADGHEIASQIPHARLEVIANCGHIPSVEQPHAFLKSLTTFAGG